MRYHLISLLLIFQLCGTSSWAQLKLNPKAGYVFEDSSLTRIDIIIHPDSLAALLHPNNLSSDHEYPANMIFRRGIERDTIQQVGFRLRGNTSRGAGKKSFRISVNTFNPGARYKGFKDFNLIGNHNDPSISRAKIFWELTDRLGSAGARANHTELYINGVYRGLYVNVEHINDDFVLSRYGNETGNLYKCLYPADLVYISNNPNDYKFTSQGRRAYDLQTNTTADNYADLAHFIRVLHQTPAAQILCALDTVFNVEDYLLALAIDVSTGNWDGYYNKNNFYLYKNAATNKFEYLPYDVDNTLGIDWFGINWQSNSPYTWKPNQSRPLYEKLMANQEARNIFNFYLKRVSDYIQQNSWTSWLDSLHTQITPAALADQYRTLDYGYTNTDFLQSFTKTSAIGHVKIGIKPFFNTRAVASLGFLPASSNIAPLIRRTKVQGQYLGQEIRFTALVEDEQASPTVSVKYTWAGQQFSLPLFDDGQHDDGLAGDGVYSNVLSARLNVGTLTYQWEAEDGQQNVRIRPCAPAQLFISQTGPLVINELMADNSGTIQDNTGAFSDWIELYNQSNDSIALAGLYLTDNAGNPNKWGLPNVKIGPQAHLLVWASGVTTWGPFHTNFGLSRNGESLFMFKSEAGTFKVVDSVSFGAQQVDVSWGRVSDGNPNWIRFAVPTPGRPNLPTSVNHPKQPKYFRLYPNPNKGSFYVANELLHKAKMTVFTSEGKACAEYQLIGAQLEEVHFNLHPGNYLVQLKTESWVTYLQMIVQP